MSEYDTLTKETKAQLKQSSSSKSTTFTPPVLNRQKKETFPAGCVPTLQDCQGVTVAVHRPSKNFDATAKCVLIHCHGGGWVSGSVYMLAATSQYLADNAGCIVVSVEYRLAPEHKFPAAVDDCITVTRAALDDPSIFGAASDAIVGVGGDSAGGNLAAVACQQLSSHPGRKIAFQVLVYPTTDMTEWSPSSFTYASGFGLSMDMKTWFRNQYLNTDDERFTEKASPALRKDLSDLPAAITILASHDMNHDEGLVYAQRLAASGVASEIHEYQGVIHGFFSKPKNYPEAVQAQEAVVRFIKSRIDLAFPSLPSASL